ncbi:hypothetical protein [Mesorhizobium sp. WSM3224]|nr:hypothetical protein [Mesorhizobium sp. WSM3224]
MQQIVQNKFTDSLQPQICANAILRVIVSAAAARSGGQYAGRRTAQKMEG